MRIEHSAVEIEYLCDNLVVHSFFKFSNLAFELYWSDLKYTCKGYLVWTFFVKFYLIFVVNQYITFPKTFSLKKLAIAENQNMNGNFKINPRGSHNLFELNKLICWSNYFKNTNTLPAVYSQRWRNKVASTLICIIFEKAPYTTPYKPPALHNGVKKYLKSQLIISYSF